MRAVRRSAASTRSPSFPIRFCRPATSPIPRGHQIKLDHGDFGHRAQHDSAAAQAFADVRVERLADLDTVDQKLRERVKNQRLKDAQVELLFERTFPPLEPTAAARGPPRTRSTFTPRSARSLR